MAKKCWTVCYKDYSALRTARLLRETQGGGQQTGGQQTGNGNNDQKQTTSNIDEWGQLNAGRISKMDDRTPNADGASPASIKWFQDHMGMNYAEAKEAAEAFLYYSYHGDYEAHRDIGKGVTTNDILDKVINANNAYIYTGTQHRGIKITRDGLSKMGITGVTPRQFINSILKTGVWKEPGATSFGAGGEMAAKAWAGYYSSSLKSGGGVSCVVEYVGGKTGFPMRHLSKFPNENEVLHSRREMSRGMQIVDYKWDGHYVKIRVTDR